MKKEWIVVIIVVLIVVFLGIYFYSLMVEPPEPEPEPEPEIEPPEPEPEPEPEVEPPEPAPSECVGEDEVVDVLAGGNWEGCCEGLTISNICSYKVSIADECYDPPIFPSGCIYLSCTNCGDGICKDNEDVCSCPEDCIGVKESQYPTVEDFCNEGFDIYCSELRDYEICKLCVASIEQG